MEDGEKVNLAQSVRYMRENMPAMLDYAKLQAQMYKARFDALRAAGFTSSEALELCWRGTP